MQNLLGTNKVKESHPSKVDSADAAAGAFHPDVMQSPLLIHDLDGLTRKLQRSTGLLSQYWNDFQNTFLTNPDTRADMIFLATLVDSREMDEARELLLGYFRQLAEDDCADDVQFHTWCRCGAVTRRAVFFDWLAARDAWSSNQIEQAAESLVGFAFKHVYPVLNSRTRASDNQAISMALNCAVIGFLFGHKLANHSTAKFLFDYGLGRLPDLLGLFPQDGYGGEGSTYTSHVNTPLLCWSADFLKQLTGRHWADVRFGPNGSTLRRMIEMELRLISPGGLLAPWDHYGWQPAIHGAPFAHLAGLANDPRYLSIIPSLTNWSHAGLLAWGADDPLWTLVWWPEEFSDYDEREVPAELSSWFLPRTGAALDDVPRKSRLMQVWDACADNVSGVGRAQCNPNHLMFDYGGEPVFQDGVPDGQSNPWQFTDEQVLASLDSQEYERLLSYASSQGDRYATLSQFVLSIAPGLIGAANAIVVDEEPWYWPLGSRVGRPTYYGHEQDTQVVSADCAAFYQPRYDVTKACRTSLWSREGFGIVHDVLEAYSSHTWRWQVHLRPNVTLDGDSARIHLPNGHHVLLVWEPVERARMAALDGFPRTAEKCCKRLELLQSGPTAEFAVLIAPDAELASIRRMGQGVFEVVVDGQTHQMSLPRFGNVPPVAPDVHRLSDIEVERNLQFPEFERLVKWAGTPVKVAASSLSQTDECLNQLVTAEPDEELLLQTLNSPHWQVRIAAVDVLGRRDCQAATKELRQLLCDEHAIPKDRLYPPVTRAAGKAAGKRWRLKAALITALGRLRDRQSIPILKQILSDAQDFYPVYSAAAGAIGRIGGPGAVELLSYVLKENEPNTRARALAALATLRHSDSVVPAPVNGETE